MKFLEIIYYPGKGGAEEYIFNVSGELKKLGHEVLFLYSENGPLVSKMESEGYKTDKLKMRSPFDIFAIFKAYKYLKENKIDVIQTHFLRENFIFSVAGRLAKASVILTTICRIEKKTAIQEFFQRFYSRFVDRYIAVAEVAKRYLLTEGISEDKIEVVPNSLPEIRFLNRDEARKKLKLEKEEFIIGSIGRVNPEKRFDLIIEIAKNYKEAKFVVIGDGPELEKIKKQSREENITNISFLGYLDRAAEHIKAFDILLITSDIEVLPTVALEAMRAEIPIISRPLECLDELIEDGVSGMIADLDQIPEKINILKNKSFCAKITSAAKKKVMLDYDLEKNVQKIVELCNKIINTK